MRAEVLFVIRIDPAGHQIAMEVISEILTFAAFDVPLRVLFIDRGVMLFSPGIDSEIAGMIAALPLYGVTDLFIERESLEDCGLASVVLPEGATTLLRAEVPDFLHQHSGVMGA